MDVHTRDGTLKKGMKDETFFSSCYATNKNLRKEFNRILQSIPYLFRNDFKKFGIVWVFLHSWNIFFAFFQMFSHSLLMFKEVEVEVVEVSGSQQATFVAMGLYLLAEGLVTPSILLPVEAAQEDGLQFT